ncbi:MAG: feruloyl-CoA synthase [Burkholderiales bacterium]|nr:feruloyl-CoA synthase [Burkholderiales bacterium]
MTAPRYRDFRFAVTRASASERAGALYLRSDVTLGAYPERLSDCLVHWALARPEATWMAERGADGAWVRITYAEAWQRAQALGEALLAADLSAERPLAILSENSLEHALLMLGATVAGVPYCSVSPAYSLISRDFGRLKHVLATLTPGMVYAADYARYGAAIEATVAGDVTVVTGSAARRPDGRTTRAYADLAATVPTTRVAAARMATGPDTIVKFLFTSGSTKLPKAVINTNRMLCANQRQIEMAMPSLFEEPPVLVDWPPWSHTFGGNHDINLTLFHGGTFYIDDGRPTPELFGITVRNLTEIAPTAYYNVPVGFEMLAVELRSNGILRRNLFSRLRMFFYAGAALAQPVWDALFEVEEAELGERIPMLTGLGMSESAPFAIFVTGLDVRSGDLGLPAAGMEAKLVPLGDKVEVRYRGPNITPGYWRNPEATAESFDEEGFFRTGDAVRWIDPNDRHRGLHFDGRVAEDFKLVTGTFVSVGPLRARIIAAGAPYVQDAVITGLNEHDVGALIVPALIPCRTALGLDDAAGFAEIAAHAGMRAAMQAMLDRLAMEATGSASRLARLVVLDQAPGIDAGEVTDKGSINQRAVLTRRADLVRALHAGSAAGMLRPLA